MHPNAAFRFQPDDPALAFVAAYGFAHIFGTTPDGPRVAHAPLLVLAGGAWIVSLWDWNLVKDDVHFSTEWAAMLGFEVHELAPRRRNKCNL